MKVPSITKKVKSDYDVYFDEFTQSVNASFEFAESNNESHLFFKKLYPLFVLLESFSDSDYFIDPSQDILLGEYVRNGDKDKALEIARKLRNIDEQSKLLREGSRRLHFTPYFDELYSDGLLLLNNYYLNNYRGCYISLRCILEDLYRHLYFKDHREEYLLVQSDSNEHELGLRPSFYREYLGRVSYLNILKQVNYNFSPSENGNNFFSWNDELYSITSSSVHGSKIGFMNRFNCNRDMVFNETESKRCIDVTSKIANLCVVFLVCGHLTHFNRFNDYVKSIIFDGFTDQIKCDMRAFLNI